MADRGVRLRLSQQKPIPLDVEIECHAGELLALVGPSGSGKSTILRCIAGLNQPDKGFVHCGHEVWLDRQHNVWLPTQERRIGFVFQDYALFPHLTAAQNVIVALGHLNPNERVGKAFELLERVNLKGLEGRYPDRLSGGQRQRVALARALAREPEILLLDEPFSAVDQVTRKKLQQELAILRRDIKIPILLVTHDLDEAAVLADRLYVLHKGQTLQNGPPDEVSSRPVSALVARLMGHSNIFSGTIKSHDESAEKTYIDWGELTLELALNTSFGIGAEVDWVIHPAHLIMHRRGRPSLGERENPVFGVVHELIELGESSKVGLQLGGDEPRFLNFTVSRHSALRNGLAVGVEAGVSLLAEGIHLMPKQNGELVL